MAYTPREQPVTAGQVMVAYIALSVCLIVYTRTVGADLNTHWELGNQLCSLAPDAFLAWQVTRGSRALWGALLAWNVLPFMLFIVFSEAQPTMYVLGLCAFGLAQIGLLFHPAVRPGRKPRSTQLRGGTGGVTPSSG